MNTAHYPSLELCKKLTEIGFTKAEKGIEETSYGSEIGTSRYTYVCPSVMEMFDVIPDHISFIGDEGKGWDYVWQLLINKRVADYGYDVFYNRLIQEPFNLYKTGTSTLPNALAEMILWLHENNYISFTK